jgi:D-lactate dehydrogenase
MMTIDTDAGGVRSGETYDLMFFEALGEENGHLREALSSAADAGRIPAGLRCYIGTETLQEFIAAHPGAALPDILSVKTHSVIPEDWLASGGVRKSIITRSAGYDHVEHLQRVANVTSLRRYCVNAVAETALKFVLAACGNLNQYQKNSETFERNSCVSFRELTGLRAAVFGVGNIGRRIYDLLEGCGTDTVAVDIREKELSALYGDRVRFVSAEEAVRSDVIVCGMSYTRDPSSPFFNRGYFSEEFLRSTPRGLVFVNVTRGELADEVALLRLYREGHIFGIGLDTFSSEDGLSAILNGRRAPSTPAEEAQTELIRLALSREGNIYTQPHQAFNSDAAAKAKADETLKHLEAYYRNGRTRFDSQLPYYG